MSARWLRLLGPGVGLGLGLGLPACTEEPAAVAGVVFESRSLSRSYYAEGCASADVNGDGHADMFTGPFWYEGPSFDVAHELDVPKVYAYDAPDRRYFLNFARDLDGDDLVDALVVGYPGTDARWYKNPRPVGSGQHWQSFVVAEHVGLESPAFASLVGSSTPELIYENGGALGYAVQQADASLPWVFHPISGAEATFDAFTHGLGVGDIDGDGLDDVVVSRGWYRQRPGAERPEWAFSAYDFAAGKGGGAQMLVSDVDGDGDSDVITSLDAHGYGLFWYETRAADAGIDFVSHTILGSENGPDNFSQLHALAAADFDVDEGQDFVTGKRWWAHLGSDPGEHDPAVVYWFELLADRSGFTPHLVDDDSGVGVQVCAGDLNDDGKPDIFASNKRGIHLHLRR